MSGLKIRRERKTMEKKKGKKNAGRRIIGGWRMNGMAKQGHGWVICPAIKRSAWHGIFIHLHSPRMLCIVLNSESTMLMV